MGVTGLEPVTSSLSSWYVVISTAQHRAWIGLVHAESFVPGDDLLGKDGRWSASFPEPDAHGSFVCLPIRTTRIAAKKHPGKANHKDHQDHDAQC